MEDDPPPYRPIIFLLKFQSTSSAWRTTFYLNTGRRKCQYFNPRPPHGGRLIREIRAERKIKFQSTSSAWRTTKMGKHPKQRRQISIHVLRMEDDKKEYRLKKSKKHFNPRPPHGGRQLDCIVKTKARPISIHVLRMEDDNFLLLLFVKLDNFNPRPPHGGRPIVSLPVIV